MNSPSTGHPFRSDVFRRVDFQTHVSSLRWHETPDTLPDSGTRYGPEEKSRNDAQLQDLMSTLKVVRKSGAYALKESTRAALRSRLRRMIIGMDLPENEDIQAHEDGFSRLTEDFVRKAKAFDPDIPDSFIGQALRNLWIFASLQVLFFREPNLTPSGIGYSLLYPYTDNYVDDPLITANDKKEFINRLEWKLRGYGIQPSSPLEEKVIRLIDMIGEQYPRSHNPEIYESLLAIHLAQAGSVCQQSLDVDEEENLVPLTMRKGGTSVLADAFLVRGELTPQEFEFAFQYGVVLQLIDDFQDVQEDHARQSRTLFTTTRSRGELERRSSKTFQLVSDLGRSRIFQDLNQGESFRQIIQTGCRMLLFEGIARNLPWFGEAFVNFIEQCSPVSLSLLGQLKSRMPD